MKPRIGSLFSGYGGLDIAAEQTFDATMVFHVENDAAASAVLAARWPGVPNYGDITLVDWSKAGSIDLLTAGFPCQDVSVAGRRAGFAVGTRSGLWANVVHTTGILRPQMLIAENVKGLLNAYANRTVEPGDSALGDGSTGSLLRAAGAVLGDLADLGYDALWAVLRCELLVPRGWRRPGRQLRRRWRGHQWRVQRPHRR